MQNTAYEMSISDWSSDVCSFDLESEVARAVDHDLSDRLLPLGVVARFIEHRGGQAVARARLGVTAAGIDEGTRRDETLGDERNLRILGARVGFGYRC